MNEQGQPVVVKIARPVKIQERKTTEAVTIEIQAATTQI